MSHLPFHRFVRGAVLAAFALLIPAIGAAQTPYPNTDYTYPYPSSSGPNTTCASGATSLASYQALGYAGCTVGKATFYNFSFYDLSTYNYLDGTTPTVVPAITITPGSDLAHPSLTFDTSALTPGNYQLEYYVDPPIDILGFAMEDAPFVGTTNLLAEVCTGYTFNNGCSSTPPDYCEGDCCDGDCCDGECAAAFPGLQSLAVNQIVVPTSPVCIDAPNGDSCYSATIDGTNESFNIPFSPTQFLDVLLTFSIDTGGSIPGVSATVIPAPEPGEFALTTIGGLALLGTTRRARRRAKVDPA